MKHTLTRILALMLCLCLVVPFAGCGNSEEASGLEEGRVTESTDAAESTETAESTDATEADPSAESTEATASASETQASSSTQGTVSTTAPATKGSASTAKTTATKASTTATTKNNSVAATTKATAATTTTTTTAGKKPIITFTTTTEWTTATTAAPKNPLRVLSIGHSFSKDAMEAYLWDLLNESGQYDYIVCAYLFYPGCSLDSQWDRINGNIDPSTGTAYEYQQYRKTDPYYGSWSTQYKQDGFKNLAAYAIQDEDWDIITLQPSPDYGAGPEVCKGKDDYDHVGDIVSWINRSKTNRNAKIYYHMTWSFATDCRLWSFMYSNYDQMQMYNDFVNATKKYIFGAHPNKFAGIIPAGTSIQNARSSKLGDVFNMPGNYDSDGDGYHLNDRGDYVAALTWYAVLTGKSAKTAWCPDKYADEFAIFAEAVDAAVKTPYEVTQSSYT